MNPTYKALSLIGLVVFSLSSIAVWRPEKPLATPENAPILGALAAQPVERVHTQVLRRGETLTDALARAEIMGSEFAELLLALREYVSPRRLLEGTEITARHWVADGTPRSVELRLNADSTVRLTRRSLGWESEVIVVPTVIDTVYVAGTIEQGRALYQAIAYDESTGLPWQERDALADELYKVFEFKLDFTREIWPGDQYRLVYQREARPDGSARTRKILIAEIENRGKVYSAIHFAPHGSSLGGFYDRDGESLRGGFSRYPVDYRRVTSTFSWRRYHPILGIYRAHLGTDYGAPYGARVKATGDGRVAFAGRDGGYGNVVVIRHYGGYTTRYAHLTRFAVRAGRAVKQGDVIGYVGATGLATGPHLHYELHRNGRALNATTVKLPGGPPLTGELKARFQELLLERTALLEDAMRTGPRLARTGAGQASYTGGM